MDHPRNAAKDTKEDHCFVNRPSAPATRPLQPREGQEGRQRTGWWPEALVLVSVNCMAPLRIRVTQTARTAHAHRPNTQERGTMVRTGISLGVTEVIPMVEGEDPHGTG